MTRKPSDAELLDLAHETMQKKIIPQLEGDIRYHSLMVAKVLGIIKRKIGSQEENILGKNDDFFNLFKSNELEVIESQLASEIRNGMHGPGSSSFDVVESYLLNKAERKVTESNPNYK